jgi:hypothetical protein
MARSKQAQKPVRSEPRNGTNKQTESMYEVDFGRRLQQVKKIY